MKNPLFILGLLLFLAACSQQKSDKIFHYSTMDAMRNGIYIGNISVMEIMNNGDFGLGTYNLLDGELIALDGIVYRVAADGTVEIADEKRKIPFTSFTFFKTDQTITLKNVKNLIELQKRLFENLPSKNRFYAIKIETTFKDVALGGAYKVKENDTIGIAHLMKNRPQYPKHNIKGTIVGFYNPSYIGGIDLFPYHFHFLSQDKSSGGHLIDGVFSNAVIKIEIDEKNSYELVLPENVEGYQKYWNRAEAKSQY